MLDYLPILLRGMTVTVQVVFGGIVIALVLGILVGLGTSARSRWLRWPARTYVEIFRGTSALVQLFWFFYVLPQLLGITLSALFTGMLVLGINISAYLAEVVRGALAGVPKGQREAAIALGLDPLQRLWRGTLPQAIPAMLPPWSNLVIELTKGSALVFFIGLFDATAAAKTSSASYPQDVMEIFLVAAALYGVFCLLLVLPIKLLERERVLRGLGRLALTMGTPIAWIAHVWRRLPWWSGQVLAGLVALASLGMLILLGVRFAAVWRGDFALEILPILLKGLWVTIIATAGGAGLALVLGLVWAGLRGVPWLGLALRWVLEAIRATPLLLQLFLLFYGVLPLLGFNAPPLWVGFIALGVHYSTYTAEVYRAGIQAVPGGQREAARALGLSPAATFWRVIVPQAVPRSIPALGNYVVAMFKETPLLAAISVMELLGRADVIASEHFRSIEPYTLVGVAFLLLSLVAAAGIRLTERLLPVRHA
jgi:polar amino acid transport system permease protein